jgi:hypothetical protein
MLLMRLLPNRLVLQELLNHWEETGFFIFGMRLYKFMPRQTIPDEGGFVGFHDVWCLVIDRIIPPEDGVVHHTHVARTTRKHVVLTRNVELSSLFATERQTQTFLVAKRGVGINARGLSAHGFGEAALVVILNTKRKRMMLQTLGDLGIGLLQRVADTFLISVELPDRL